MSQVTIYLPDEIAEKAKRSAARAKRSLSAYVAELITKDTVGSRWPKSFVELLDEGDGDIVEPEDPAPEDVEPLR